MSFATTSDRLAIEQNELSAIFISLELSLSNWVLTSISPGKGERMSRTQLVAGDVQALVDRFTQLRKKCRERAGQDYPLIVIQEAGLDAFSLHRALENEGIESHVVDPASIATSRRHRRAKTDRIDGEALLRTLLAFKRGEPRVCAMVRPPSPEEEDRRQVCRERRQLTRERVAHSNRIKGLLFAQGITGYDPLRRNNRERLEKLRTADGRALPLHLRQRICRELDRLELVASQIKLVEKQRDELVAEQDDPRCIPALLQQLRGVGPGQRRSSGRKGYSEISVIEGSWRPMQGSLRRHGRADRLLANRESQRPAMPGCERRWFSSAGFG